MLDIERKWEKMVSEREVWGQISKSPIYCVKAQDLHQCSSNVTEHRNHAGVFLNADFDSVGLWWTLRFRISNKLSGDVNAAGLRFHLKKKGTKKLGQNCLFCYFELFALSIIQYCFFFLSGS